MQVPMLDLRAEYSYMKADIDAAIAKCLDHQRWIFGPEVKELEEKITGYLGAKHCIGSSSGTEALVLALRAIAVKRKGKEYFDRADEIITTSFTFTATGDAILRAGATPVFVDIDPETYNIDTGEIKKYLGSGGKGKVVGILPVHLYGHACDMDEISMIAAENGLFIVEDVAQAFGAAWNGKKLGSLGDAGAFSFFPSKNLGGFGDGGMVSTNDDETAGLIRMLIKHGGKDKYNVDHIGYNARLDTLQAAIVLAKFEYIDEFNGRRRAIADMYTRGLADLRSITVPIVRDPEKVHHVYHQYTLRCGRRDELQSFLKEKGVSTMVYYPFPLHRMKVFGSGMCSVSGDLGNAEEACTTVLSLPVEPLQSEEVTRYTIDAITEFDGNG